MHERRRPLYQRLNSGLRAATNSTGSQVRLTFCVSGQTLPQHGTAAYLASSRPVRRFGLRYIHPFGLSLSKPLQAKIV